MKMRQLFYALNYDNNDHEFKNIIARSESSNSQSVLTFSKGN